MVVGWASQGLAGGSSEWAEAAPSWPASKSCPSQVKAEVVYSADWLRCFFLNLGYLARRSKKLVKARSRCRKACCGGTGLDLVQPGGRFLLLEAGVRAAEVSR